MQSSALAADRDGDGTRDGATRSSPLGDSGGGVNGNGNGNGNCTGNGNDNGNGNGNGNGNRTGNRTGNGNVDVNGKGTGNCNVSGNGNDDDSGNGDASGSGNGALEDAPGGDSRSLSNVSRAKLLVRMGLVRARLGGGMVAGDRGLRPAAESLWRDVEAVSYTHLTLPTIYSV